MPPALFTVTQSRWALSGALALLSAVAIASGAPASVEGAPIFSGLAGDIGGPAVLLGSTGLGGITLLRVADFFLPRPWRIYLDRLEFTFVALLWICWTSATMTYSYFTLVSSVCAEAVQQLFTPTCPVLTFDLALLHLLSTTTLALLLVILSTALSPNYFASMSPSYEASKDDQESMFVMWELALASPPSSPRLGPTRMDTGFTPIGYGTTGCPSAKKSSQLSDVENPYETGRGASATMADVMAVRKRDKFADGRLWSYFPLLGCSLGVTISGAWVLGQGDYVLSNVFVISVALLSTAFAVSFLLIHYKQRDTKIGSSEGQTYLLRHDRALEVGFAAALYLLWPFAAIIYTLYPSTPNRPCTHPAASAVPLLDDDITLSPTLCFLSGNIVFLSWLSAWIILARVLGLIFPMPEMRGLPTLPIVPQGGSNPQPATQGGERASLLRTSTSPVAAQVQTPERPQVKWGRMVAGEAFELGDAEDDDDGIGMV